MNSTVFVVGPAGSGKSTFTGSFQEWMKRNSYDAITVNLDPGAEFLPYEPDIDIRDYIQLQEIMQDYSLGPNGAQILAADLVANQIDDLKKEIEEFETDYVLVDTPGQLELFAFRTSSEFIMDQISEGRGYIAFLMDPMVAISPAGYVSLLTLSASVFFRFYIPFINLINKIDLVSDSDLSKLRKWSTDPELLYEDLRNEKPKMNNIYLLEVLKSLQTIGYSSAPVFCSSKELKGMEEIYLNIQLTYSGGEDIEKR
ncbi:MAG: ATP/GTP-binding protein [Thermoplasmata archaeon]